MPEIMVFFSSTGATSGMVQSAALILRAAASLVWNCLDNWTTAFVEVAAETSVASVRVGLDYAAAEEHSVTFYTLTLSSFALPHLRRLCRRNG